MQKRSLKKTLKDRLKRSWKWLRRNVLNKSMLLWVLISELIFWSPSIVLGILAITANKAFWAPFGAYIAFWAGPFTPAMPLQLGLAKETNKSCHLNTMESCTETLNLK